MPPLRWAVVCVLPALPGAAQWPAFEVVSIKPNKTEDLRTRGQLPRYRVAIATDIVP
jgi:hypothetical protein